MYNRDPVCLLRGTDWTFIYISGYPCPLEPHHGTGGESPTSNRGDPGFISYQPMWHLWGTKWHWDRFLARYISFFFLSASFRQCSTLISIYILVSPESQRSEAWEIRKIKALSDTGSTRRVFVLGLWTVQSLVFGWELHNMRTFFYLHLYENILMMVCGMPKHVAYIVKKPKKFQFTMKLNCTINHFFMSAQHLLLLIIEICLDWSLSHLQVLNMLQVLDSCAHIWDPSSVYIEVIH